jgi:beta-galactosidase
MTYFGTVPSESIIKNILASVLGERSLLADQALPDRIKVKHGVSNGGKNLHFYYNFSAVEQSFSYQYTDGVNLLTNLPIQKGKPLTLKAWDVAVIESK